MPENAKEILGNLLNKISLFAVNMLKVEVAHLDSSIMNQNGGCYCSIKVLYKLPCRHIIARIGVLSLEDIPGRWHLYPLEPPKNNKKTNEKEEEKNTQNTENYQEKNTENTENHQQKNTQNAENYQEKNTQNTESYQEKNTQNEEETNYITTARRDIIQKIVKIEKIAYKLVDISQLNDLKKALDTIIDKGYTDLEDIDPPPQKVIL